jgi:hypothetical protein
MGKIVKESYRVGEAGVILFNNYCNEHNPFIIFREVTKHDFGIDGELELTRKNEDGKTEATAEILKVQIKSVNSDNSYIKNETENKFDFYAEPDDLDYWLKHQKYNLQVLLIIVDLRNNIIYAKKINDTDIYSSKKKGQRIPIEFNKELNKLEKEKNNFIEKFSTSFKSRVNFDTEEVLLTNSLQVKKVPKGLFKYKAKYSNKKEIFGKITNADAPHFVVKSNYIYTFRNISLDCKNFCKEILIDTKSESIGFQTIKNSIDLTNIYLELFYEHIKHDLYSRDLVYSKDYHRFYFKLRKTEELLEVKTRTRKTGSESLKKVVTHHIYGKTEFFRHLAVDLRIKFFDGKLFVIINPKYLFTKDRKEPLTPKQITRYTNFLTSREFNNEYANTLHFWRTYLFKGAEDWLLSVSNKENIIIGDYEKLTVKFSIPLDNKPPKIKMKAEETYNQQSLDLDEN